MPRNLLSAAVPWSSHSCQPATSSGIVDSAILPISTCYACWSCHTLMPHPTESRSPPLDISLQLQYNATCPQPPDNPNAADIPPLACHCHSQHHHPHHLCPMTELWSPIFQGCLPMLIILNPLPHPPWVHKPETTSMLDYNGSHFQSTWQPYWGILTVSWHACANQQYAHSLPLPASCPNQWTIYQDSTWNPVPLHSWSHVSSVCTLIHSTHFTLPSTTMLTL